MTAAPGSRSGIIRSSLIEEPVREVRVDEYPVCFGCEAVSWVAATVLCAEMCDSRRLGGTGAPAGSRVELRLLE